MLRKGSRWVDNDLALEGDAKLGLRRGILLILKASTGC